MKRRVGIRQLVGDPIPGRIGEACSGVALNGHHYQCRPGTQRKAHEELVVWAANRAAMRVARADAMATPTVKDIKALAARREKPSSPSCCGGC